MSPRSSEELLDQRHFILEGAPAAELLGEKIKDQKGFKGSILVATNAARTRPKAFILLIISTLRTKLAVNDAPRVS